MKRWAILVVVLVSGCSQSTSHPVAQATLTPSTAVPTVASPTPPSPVASPSPIPSPSSAAFADLPLTTLGFSCRLPIVWDDASLNDIFISFPDGKTSLDPNSHGFYFDRAVSRWLPVSRRAVSSDGASYATIEPGNNDFLLHVVATVTGKESVFHLSSQAFSGQPDVFDYSADGIYLVNGFEHLQAGLWLVDPSTGSMRQVSSDIYPIYNSGNGVIWTQVVNPSDPHSIASGTSLGTLPDEIDRVDLRSGARTRWLYAPGRWLQMVGFDGRGAPLIVSKLWTNDFDPTGELFLVAAPDSERLIYKGEVVQMLGGGISDAHGTWIGISIKRKPQ